MYKLVNDFRVLTFGLNEFPGRKGRAMALDLLPISHRYGVVRNIALLWK